MSSSRVLEVQSTLVGPEGCLWAHSGRLHHRWPLLSLCRLTVASLSPGGLKTPFTLHSRFGSTADRSPTLFGATQPLSPPHSMHEAPGKGGCSQSALISAPRVHSGPRPSPPPPSGLAVLIPIIYNRGTTETDAHTSYPICPFPHTYCLPPRSFSLAQHSLYLPPLLTPL
jgi:hypothetical protein